MLEIKLNNHYKIETRDELNITLYRKIEKTEKTKKDTWKTIGFFGSMEHLVYELVEREIKLFDAKTFKEVLKNIEDLKNAIAKL